jgi:sporulation protein YlmC with PRC-barrel domain
MSERFAAAVGRKVVSRASAEKLGKLSSVVVDLKHRKVNSLVVGKGRNARLVDWKHVTGFGPDAVIVAKDTSLYAPRDDPERAAAAGKTDLLGKRALSDMGAELGAVVDVEFDAETGVLESLMIGERELDASSLLGAGSYAAIFSAPED